MSRSPGSSGGRVKAPGARAYAEEITLSDDEGTDISGRFREIL